MPRMFALVVCLGRCRLTGMVPSILRRLALAGMVALLVGAAPLAQTAEPAKDDTIETLRTRANAGDAEAQLILGHAYRGAIFTRELREKSGFDVPENDVEALAWMRMAAEQGHAEAQDWVGLMLDPAFATGFLSFGRGVPKDAVEAAAWYRKAAEQGKWNGQWHLAQMYRDGSGVPQDDVEAYKWVGISATTSTDASRRETSAEERDTLAERLTPEQLAEGQKRVREWIDAHPPE